MWNRIAEAFAKPRLMQTPVDEFLVMLVVIPGVMVALVALVALLLAWIVIERLTRRK